MLELLERIEQSYRLRVICCSPCLLHVITLSDDFDVQLWLLAARQSRQIGDTAWNKLSVYTSQVQKRMVLDLLSWWFGFIGIVPTMEQRFRRWLPRHQTATDVVHLASSNIPLKWRYFWHRFKYKNKRWQLWTKCLKDISYKEEILKEPHFTRTSTEKHFTFIIAS